MCLNHSQTPFIPGFIPLEPGMAAVRRKYGVKYKNRFAAHAADIRGGRCIHFQRPPKMISPPAVNQRAPSFLPQRYDLSPFRRICNPTELNISICNAEKQLR